MVQLRGGSLKGFFMKKLHDILSENITAIKYTESPIEVLIFKEMNRRRTFVLCKEGDSPVGEGLFMFPQYVVGKYRADFVIRGMGYRPTLRVWPPKIQATIAVECDGKEFHSTPEQKEHDKEREKYFMNNGIKTIRFTGSEIYKNPRFCVDQIESFIHSEMLGDFQGGEK